MSMGHSGPNKSVGHSGTKMSVGCSGTGVFGVNKHGYVQDFKGVWGIWEVKVAWGVQGLK